MEYLLCKKLENLGYKGNFDLSSLIEACGDSFENLNRGIHGEWEVNVKHFDHDTGYPQAVGDTPETAIANLWLEINDK